MSQPSGVRFTLKKRAIRNSLDVVNISSYNSDFLSGIFADVAKITEMADSSSAKRSRHEPTTALSDEVTNDESPMKKQRTGTLQSASMNRCKYSSYNLSDLDDTRSPESVIEEPRQVVAASPQPHRLPTSHGHTPQTVTQSARQDSLAFQLDCVAGSECSNLTTETAAVVAFPNLPATVSDSSCSAGLTRGSLIKQASSPEKLLHKESFGWFVDLDDHQSNVWKTISSYSTSCPDLAFRAPTAPNASHNDAAVQWAKAADTVDDVLGDFF